MDMIVFVQGMYERIASDQGYGYSNLNLFPKSIDKHGYLCYNINVLISYQERLGCYDKVATYRSVPQSSDDRFSGRHLYMWTIQPFLRVTVVAP